ncbi:MAG: high-potential iron-sulfur protein [Betaproteobacteria bacterium]
MTTRRSFIQIIPVAGVAALSARVAFAATPELDPKDPQAAALGYVPDATKADKAKFPKYASGQLCGNCQLYQGKAGDTAGPCAIFAGKSVQAKGWCSAYAKKT